MYKYHAPIFGVKTNYKKPVFFFDSIYIDDSIYIEAAFTGKKSDIVQYPLYF